MIRRLPYIAIIATVLVFAQTANAQYKARPVISSLSPSSGVPGSTVTINGKNFGPEYKVEYNGVQIKPTKVTATKIVVTLPANAVQGRFTLKGPVHQVTSPQVFWVVQAVAAPVITGISPTTGPPGTVVTISGSNFSRKAHENNVSLGGVPVTVRSASTKKIKAIIPDKAKTGNFTVQVYNAGQATSSKTFSVLSKLVISQITPASGPPGTHVTLSGSGFSGKKRNNTVTIGGVKCKLVSASANQLVVIIPKKNAESGKFAIKVKGGDSYEHPSAFPVIFPPEVSKFSPASGKVGTEVIIKGTNFGVKPSSVQVLLTGRACKITSANTNEIRVTVPQGAVSGKFKIIIPQMGTAQSDKIFEVWAPLAVTRMEPLFGTPGTKVKIYGSGFRAKASNHTIYLGKKKIKIEKIDGGALIFSIPQNAPDGPVNFRLEVAERGATMVARSFTVMHAPKIDKVSPIRGSIGQIVNITGSYFGTKITHIRVLLNGQLAQLLAVTPTKITMTVPPGASSGKIEVQTVRRGSDTAKKSFEVFTPVKATNFLPSLGHSGQTVYVFGSGFDSKASKNKVTINGVKLKVLEATPSKIKFKLAKNVSTGNIKVEVTGRGSSETLKKFTVVQALKIKTFTPTKGVPGVYVTIKGKGFENKGLRGYIDQTPIGVRVDSPNQVTIAIPEGADSGKFRFTAPGAGSDESKSKFSVLTPLAISSFQPAYGPVGTKVSIFGTGFDPRPDKTKVTYNHSILKVENGSTEGMLIVKIPKGSKDGPFKVKVRGRGTAESEDLFSVVNPTAIPIAKPAKPAATVAAKPVAKPVATPTAKPAAKLPTPVATAAAPKAKPAGMDDMLGISGEQAKISGFDPMEAPVGELIMIEGSGFGENMNVVKAWVGNVPASVLGVLPDMVQIEVPNGVRRGSIKIKVGNNPVVKSKKLLKVIK